MRLKNTETNQTTKIKNDKFTGLDFIGAADRLAKRVMPGHFAIGIYYFEERLLYNKNTDFEIELAICRSSGKLIEQTNKKITLTVID